MPKGPTKDALHGHWMHSHEEDTGDRTVYRPASYAFPRSRGRSGFELRAGGSLVDHGVGPTDKRQATEGKWSLSDDGVLTLDGANRKKLKVISADKDKLVVQKI